MNLISISILPVFFYVAFIEQDIIYNTYVTIHISNIYMHSMKYVYMCVCVLVRDKLETHNNDTI